MKKTLSGLIALILVLSVCAGCGAPAGAPPSGIYYDITGIDPAETVLTADGVDVPAEMYFYWLGYSCNNLEYQIMMLHSYYGMYGELMNEAGQLNWGGELDGTPLSQMAMEQAESNVLSYTVLEKLAEEYSVALTDEDRASMEENLSAQMEQLGGEEAFNNSLAQMGISRSTFDRIAAAGYLFDHLQTIAADPSSDLYAPPSDDNAYVDHILLMTVDSTTREPLSDEEIAAKRTQAEELLAQLQGAGDLEALFTQLADEHGEDPGRTAETGYLINPDTNFVQEFKDAAFALKPGEISGIVESDYGYHILLRKELTEDQLTSLAGDRVNEIIGERMEAAEVVRSEKLEAIDAGKFYNDYLAAANKMQQANEAANGGGEDGSGDSSGDGGDSSGDAPAE